MIFSGTRYRPRRLAASVACALSLTAAGLGAAPVSSASTGTTVAVDGNSPGRIFDGVGAISSNGTSKLLTDYRPGQRSQILDYLFKPDYGASVQILKVEIGGDTNSTDGTEPSHMRTPAAVDCNRGYEWWLIEQAKARNPGIRLYGLEWGAPGWVGAGTGTAFTSQNITYLLAWLGCARQHGLQINYLGGWNEHGYSVSWYEQLRSALDAHGYSGVQIVADDSAGWDDVSDLASDRAFNAAVSVVGDHYPCGYPSGSSCPTPSAAQALGKPLWASEQSNWWGEPQSYNDGAAGLARDINRDYIDGQITGFINWSLVWSAYSGFPFPGSGLMLANTPWSGSYYVAKSIWAVAHTTQFTEPGWRYLDSGSMRLAGGGSVVTLRSPDAGAWSSVVETTDASAAQQLTYNVSGGLPDGTVHVWATNLNSANQGDWFQHVTDIRPQDGSFSLSVQPGYLYTLTTTTGQHKGTAAPPAAHPLALPYADNFGQYPADALPRYFADLGGSFQTAPCTARPGMCLQQQVTQQPVQWDGVDNYPVTVVGDPTAWRNYSAQVDAYLPQSGYVELDARAQPPQADGFLGFGTGLQGYHFRAGTDGQWSVYRESGSGTSYASVVNDTTLASGTASFGVGTWQRLGLSVRGDEITATLDGRTLASVLDSTYQVGQVGLEASPWVQAQFDDLQVSPLSVPGGAAGPAVSPVSPSPVMIAAAGGSATLSTTVSNPGQLPASAVSAQLHLPAGWSAAMQTPAVSSLPPGGSAPLAWQVTAPASAAPGSYDASVVVTYQEGGLSWIATAPVTILLSEIPQSQMTATASSAQSASTYAGQGPPSYAIDGNPSTIWHTEYSPVYDPPPQSITLDLGGAYNVSGLLYLPRQDGNQNGIITSYSIEVSQDGTTFTPVASGSWALDATQKSATFTAVSNVRYVRLNCLAGGGAQSGYPEGFCSAAEINILGSPSQ